MQNELWLRLLSNHNLQKGTGNQIRHESFPRSTSDIIHSAIRHSVIPHSSFGFPYPPVIRVICPT
jgi:hypothetical protein